MLQRVPRNGFAHLALKPPSRRAWRGCTNLKSGLRSGAGALLGGLRSSLFCHLFVSIRRLAITVRPQGVQPGKGPAENAIRHL